MKRGIFIKLIVFKHFLYKHHMRWLSKFLDFQFRILFACDIPSSADIANEGTFAHHGLGVVIHPRAKIGKGFKIYQNVTIGCRKAEGPPQLGDNCYIGAGACILGDVKIGNNVSIGANAVVLKDIPDNCVAVGIPATVISRKI